MEDLGLGTGAGTVFISDQQKGLINAVHDFAPHAEHRNCARHVFINWKKSHKGITLKNIFWRAVRATHLVQYNKALDAMKKENLQAYEDFIGRDTTKFCKVFINPSTLSDMILNNTSETFNGYILQARGKHVIHMLEEIRTSRQHRKNRDLSTYTHRICPEILEKVEKIQSFSRYCIPHPSSDVLFEVENYAHRFVVDTRSRTCTCRAWDITGIPCIHASAAIHFLRQEVQDYVHETYSVERYKLTYLLGLPPLNGESMWPEAEGLPVFPPVAKKMPGRPKKKRKRNPCEENLKNPTKVRKTGVQMQCQNCYQHGHNKRGCKREPVIRAPKPKGKAGRPRKTPPIMTPNVERGPTNTNNAGSSSMQFTGGPSTTHSHSSNTSRMESMGFAGRIFGRVPAERRSIFIPSRPLVQKRAKKKKDHMISTQESNSGVYK